MSGLGHPGVPRLDTLQNAIDETFWVFASALNIETGGAFFLDTNGSNADIEIGSAGFNLYNTGSNIFGVDGTGNLGLNGKITVAGGIIYTPPAATALDTNAFTVTSGFHRIDTSGGAAVLKTINGGVDGKVLRLANSGDANSLTVDETDNISLGAATRVLDKMVDKLVLIYDASAAKWCEETFANNG